MIVDTSPVLTPLNVAILYAVAEILIPIDPCVAALAGVRALEDLVQTVSEFRLEFTDAGPLTITGVLITRADRTLVSKQIEAEVGTTSGRCVYERVVPASVKFREAYARGIPLIHYDRFSAGAEAYRAAAAGVPRRPRRTGRPRRQSADGRGCCLDGSRYLREASERHRVGRWPSTGDPMMDHTRAGRSAKGRVPAPWKAGERDGQGR